MEGRDENHIEPEKKSKVGWLLDVAFQQGFIHMKLFCPADWITKFYYVKVSKYVVFSSLYFPLFRLKSEIYWENLRIQFDNGKIQTRKIPNLDTFTQCTSSFKDPLWSEIIFGTWKLFKNDEKCFLIHLKNSFRCQDIYVFVLTFWSCIETARLKRSG